MLFVFFYIFLKDCFHVIYRYKKVAYLDTDVGQPEFTPPGFLSFTVVDKLTSGILFVI